MKRLVPALLTAAALGAAGCPAPSHLVAKPRLEPGPRPSAAALPTAPPNAVAPDEAGLVSRVRNLTVAGRVLAEDGTPAAGVTVVAQAAGLVSRTRDEGANLVSRTRYGVLQAAGLRATTDAAGRFSLELPTDEPHNVEAVAGPQVKAIRLAVAPGEGALELRLAPTGTIAGRVTAPGAPGVTDFEGVDVFIPGTAYAAKAARDGSFTLDGVPAGSFELVASRSGLGRGVATQVVVAPRTTTTVALLALAVEAAQVDAVEPPNGGPGMKVTIRGARFGANAGKALQVSFGGAIATRVERLDDRTITAEVPPSASSGDLAVLVDGASANLVTFQVLKTLSLADNARTISLRRPHSFLLTATDTAGAAVPKPTVTWAVTAGPAAVDAGGSLTPTGLGAFALKVSAGTIETTFTGEVLAGVAKVTTYAGSDQGFADGPALQARFDNPEGLALAPDGTVYVGDSRNRRVRRIAPDGMVSTIAGTGVEGRADGPGATATFGAPSSLLLHGQTLYVADVTQHVVRAIDLASGQHAVRTIAGDGTAGWLDGPVAQARFDFPRALARDAAGNLYVADMLNHRIRVIRPDGTVATIAGTGAAGFADGPGPSAVFNAPHGLCIDQAGRLIVADFKNARARAITLTDAAFPVTTIAGSGSSDFADGPALQAHFDTVMAVEPEPDGGILIADIANNRIRRLTPGGQVETLAGSGRKNYADGTGLENQAFNYPVEVRRAADGRLFVADRQNARIRVIEEY